MKYRHSFAIILRQFYHWNHFVHHEKGQLFVTTLVQSKHGDITVKSRQIQCKLSRPLRRDSPSKSSPTFSVRPCSSVGEVAVNVIRRSWVRFPLRSKDFFFASCGSLFPFTRASALSGLFMGLSSTLIYTSELILCSTICVPSATWHKIYMYPYYHDLLVCL